MLNPMQTMAMFQQFRSNPAQFLASRGLNIPEQYMNSPESAAKYLIGRSNMSQDQINSLMQSANQFQGFMSGQNSVDSNQNGSR